MKTILEQALKLNKPEFIEKITSLNQEDIIDIFNNDNNLQNNYKNKVIDIYNEGIVNPEFHKRVEFSESKALLSLLEPEQRGWVLYFSCMRGLSFKAAYNSVELGFNGNENMKKFFSTLENNIDYLHFIDNAYKPYINDETYIFVLYASFVLHVKNGFNINNKHFLNMVGMQDDNEVQKYKKQYYTNCIALINNYKEVLHFDAWNPQLLKLFHKDINTANPYNNIGISNKQYELEQFSQYGEILKKILMKSDFDKKFHEKNKNIK